VIGLRSRSQTRAVLMALGSMIAWCVVPLLVLFVFVVTFRLRDQEPTTWFLLLSPMMSVVLNEYNAYHHLFDYPWVAVVMNLAWYGALWAVVRAWCLRNAPLWLGRTSEMPVNDSPSSEPVAVNRLQAVGDEI
jgi:hypothetical protein